MTDIPRNSKLGVARTARKDEFYTQWADIEREMNAYLEYDPDVFRDKTVLLPCDDPEWSNFTKFFALHFQEYGLKKLISTSYAPNSNAGAVFYQPTMFELAAPQYSEQKSYERGRVFTLTRDDADTEGHIDIDNLKWDYLKGDGDFQSDEVKKLRDGSDIVITNPPFSLFRTFLAWIIEGNVKFSVISSQNAITYKDVFPLIRDNKIWLGKGFKGGVGYFGSPYEDTAVATDRVEGMIRVSGVAWMTNIEHGRRHEPLELMTLEENKRFNKKIIRLGDYAYAEYDNYDAMEVGFTDAIPNDHPGLMGVPISFLYRYNPEQFEILGITQSWDDEAGLKKRIYPNQTQVAKNGKRSRATKLNDGAAIKVNNAPEGSTYYEVEEEKFIKPYCRILIRRRTPEITEV